MRNVNSTSLHTLYYLYQMYQLYWFAQIYLLLTAGCGESMAWNSEIGISGLVWGPFRAFFGGGGAFCFWLMMGFLWKWLWGASGGAGVADFDLSGVIATCPFTIYHFLVNVLTFLESGFYM